VALFTCFESDIRGLDSVKNYLKVKNPDPENQVFQNKIKTYGSLQVNKVCNESITSLLKLE